MQIAPKTKEAKQKAENVDPNVTKAPKAAKDGAKKPKKAGMNTTGKGHAICLKTGIALNSLTC